MKINKNLITIISLSLLLPGCLFKKDSSKEAPKKNSKKVALVDKGRGISLNSNVDEGKFFDQEVEAFVLNEDSDFDADFLAFDAQEEMRIARADIEDIEPQWDNIDNYNDDTKKQFNPIFFGFDKHTIREDQKQTLAFDIERIKEIPTDAAITVAGHSDSHFVSDAYNIAKSEKRAREVAKELKKAGIDNNRIKIIGYGDKQKYVETAGKEEKNRRVEFTRLS